MKLQIIEIPMIQPGIHRCFSAWKLMAWWLVPGFGASEEHLGCNVAWGNFGVQTFGWRSVKWIWGDYMSVLNMIISPPHPPRNHYHHHHHHHHHQLFQRFRIPRHQPYIPSLKLTVRTCKLMVGRCWKMTLPIGSMYGTFTYTCTIKN